MRDPFPELRPFFAELRPWRGRLLLATALMTAGLLSAVGLLGLSGWFLAATAVAGAAGVGLEVYRPSTGIRFFALTRTVSRYFERLIHHDAVLRILSRLRVRLFRSLIPHDPWRLRRLRRAELLNRMTTDVDTLDNLYLRIISPTLAAALTVTVSAGLLGTWLGWSATPVIAVLVAGGVVLPVMACWSGRAPDRDMDTALPALRSRAIDAVQGLPELWTSGAMPHHRAAFLAESDRLIEARRRSAVRTGLADAGVGLIAHAALFLALLAGVTGVHAGALSGPHLALVALVALATGEALGALPGAWQHLGRTRDAARRLLDQEARPQTEGDAPEPPRRDLPDAPRAAPVELLHVTFRHGPIHDPVLEGATLRVAAGERVAIQAPSGAGKSTVLDLLSGFLQSERGRTRIHGVDLTSLQEAERFARIEYLTQETELFADTVAGNLRMARPDASDAELEGRLRALGLIHRIQSLPDGLEQWIGEGGSRLSGGEARRLALARLMLTDPGVVLLDEPFRGLDEATLEPVRRELDHWLGGRTVVMAGHHPDHLPGHDRRVTLRGRRFAVRSDAVA